MLNILKQLINKGKKIVDKDRTTHDNAFNILESLLRLYVLISLTSYSNHQSKKLKFNSLVIKNLVNPALGHWVGLLRELTSLPENEFHNGFYKGFLSTFGKQLNSEHIKEAYQLICKAVLDRGGDVSNKSKITIIDFFEVLVQYRNKVLGHGTSDLKDDSIFLADELFLSVRDICNKLQKTWLKFPVFFAEKRNIGGSLSYNLKPLVTNKDIKNEISVGPKIFEGRLYFKPDTTNNEFISLYPLILFNDNDLLYYNGTDNFEKVKYLSFLSGEQLSSGIYNKDFINEYIKFYGLKNDEGYELLNEDFYDKILHLDKLPIFRSKLKKNMIIGNTQKNYTLKKILEKHREFEIWSAISNSDHNQKKIKICHTKNYYNYMIKEAKTHINLQNKISNIIRFVDAQFDTHPNHLFAFTVFEYNDYSPFGFEIKNDSSYILLLDNMENIFKELKAIHNSNLLHGNINESNLGVDTQGKIHLTDYGISNKNDLDDIDYVLNELIQDVSYQAPEVLSKCIEKIDERSDIFSVGAIFYKLITGKIPFGKEKDTVSIATAQSISIQNQTNAEIPSNINEKCPEILGKFILHLIEPEYDERPKKVENVLSLIKQIRNQLIQGGKNSNLSLGGKIQGVDIIFDELLSPVTSKLVFIVWPIVMLLQWIIVIPLSIRNGTFFSIDPQQFGLNNLDWHIMEPLTGDIMFIIWNTIPFLLWLILLRTRKRTRSIIGEFAKLDISAVKKWDIIIKANNTLSRILKSRWVLFVAIVITGFSAWAQYGKLADLTVKGQLYWWDWRISKIAYIVRDIVLAVDMMALVYLFLMIISMIIVFTTVLLHTKLKPDFNSVDGSSGLSIVGELTTLFLPFFAIIGLNSSYGIIDHAGQEKLQVISDWFIIFLFVIIYFLVFLTYLFRVRNYIKKILHGQLQIISNKRQKLENRLNRIMNDFDESNYEQATKFELIRKWITTLTEMQKDLSKSNSFPIKTSLFFIMFLLGLSPLVLSAIFIYLTYVLNVLE